MKNILKKSLSVLLAITIIFSSAYVGLGEVDFGNLFAVKAKAASSGTCGENLTWTLDDEGTLTISGTGAMTNYYSYPSVPWYTSRKSIKNIVINSGVTSIGEKAFYYCTGLTSITIPDSVTSIGYYAFYNCTGLTSITIPDSVTSIGYYAFYYCTGLTSITIPYSVTSIGNYAFQYCTGLTSITIPDGVTSIDYSAFSGCTGLTSITIPDSVTSIGSSAFYNTGYYNNSSNWENDVLYIGNHLIEAKTSLTDQYIIKTGTKTISDLAFYYCTGLTSITIPNGVTSIGDYTFYNCTGLTSITIPDSVTSIGNSAFSYCTGLTSITIPDSVTSIGCEAFYNTGYYNNSSNWENDVLYIGNHLIKAKTLLTGQYIIKTGTKTISAYAFDSCESLTSITIPDSVTSIGYDAFYNCTGLTDVYYGGTEADWANIAIGSNNGYLTNATIHYHEHSYNSEWIVDIEPTCTEVGSRYKTCSGCSALITEEISATGHQNTMWVTEQEPTCTEDGYKDCYCLECAELISTEIILATGHSYGDWVVDSAPTCIEQGARHKTCSACGDTVNEAIDVIDHSYSTEWTVDIAPTCTENGSKSHHCTVCGEKTNVTVVDATGHSYGEWVVDSAPTCTEQGSRHKICSACGDVVNGTTDVIDHSYSIEWTIDVVPTCTEEGSKSHHCTVCSDKADITVIASLGHDFEVVSTEEKHPHTILYKCSRCLDEKQEETFSEKCGICNFSYTNIDASTCKITAYIGSASTFIIPAEIDGRTVTTTTTGAFKSNTTLTSVIIENGVQGLGSIAFLGCKALSKIVIPESVTSIGANAFYNCASDFTIYCYRDSYAMQYAIDNSLNYIVMDIGETENTRIDYANKIIFTSETFSSSIDDIVYTPSSSMAFAEASIINGSNEFLGTGSIVTVFDGDNLSEYTLIVEGDLNGDATCDVIDASVAYLYSVGLQEATENEILAANGCSSDELDAASYQNVVNMCLAS